MCEEDKIPYPKRTEIEHYCRCNGINEADTQVLVRLGWPFVEEMTEETDTYADMLRRLEDRTDSLADLESQVERLENEMDSLVRNRATPNEGGEGDCSI